MARERGLNVLLFLCHREVHDLGDGTSQAATAWANATRAGAKRMMTKLGKKQAGRR